MQWTADQDTALMRAKTWYEDKASPQVFRLFGYAGTGKTTLARTLAEDVKGSVLFGAYTGKAAYVLRKAGCPGATTIHSLIYNSRDASRARLKELEAALVQARLGGGSQAEIARLETAVEQERANAARPCFTLNTDSLVKDAALVVIDECSMVDGQIGEDLLSFGTKVLVLGDPAQLPPVMGGGYFTDHRPDVMLEQIVRQAEGNPIIRLATAVREGRRLEPGDYGESLVVPRGQRLDPDFVLKHDQIIVGKNITRRTYNQRIRQLLGRTGHLPEEGDRLVCLRNDHEAGLLNGATYQVAAVGPEEDEAICLTIVDEFTGNELDLEAHTAPFLGEKVDLWRRRDAQEFDHGYAMTCHKSQGSQWGSVLIVDESGVFRQDARNWLYTAVTRAAERVTVIA